MEHQSSSDIFSKADWLRGVKDFSADFANIENNIYIEQRSNDFIYANTPWEIDGLSNVLIGRNSYKMLSGMFSSNVIIGRYCSIAHYVNIGPTNHNYNYLTTSPLEEIEDTNYTIIGCDVWIGVNATILNGAKIGHGAVIGAGAVIKNEVPPYAIVMGNKSQIIRKRFSDEIIRDLLELQWWLLPHEKIKLLPYKDINSCITTLKKIRDEYLLPY